MKEYLISLCQFLCGAWLLGVGCALILQANLGADPLSSFALGIQKQFYLDVEIGILLISMVMMMFTGVLDRHQLGFGSLLYPFVSAYAIRITLQCLPNLHQVGLRYVVLLAGILCMGISIAICANQPCGNNPYDSLAFTLMKKANATYATIRYAIDGAFLLCGVLLGSAFGIGTMLILILLGPCAQGCLMIKEKMMLTYAKERSSCL